MTTRTKSVVMLIAPQLFRDEEYFQPKVMLEAVGIRVFTAAKGDPGEVTGTKGGKAHTDINFAEIKPEELDGLILVGGNGACVYFDDLEVHALLRTTVMANKIVGAICIAPVILANAGVLQGRQATVFPQGVSNLQEKGAEYLNHPVVVDGKIVTAVDFTVAMPFGATIAKLIQQSQIS